MDAGIEGRKFLVTGASGGIGRAIAREFAAAGADVTAHYHRNREAAERLAAELQTDITVAQADLTEEAAVDRLFETATGRAALDGIVVNAGIWVEEAVPVHEMELAQWQRTIASDLTSAFLTCRGYLRHVAETRPDNASIVLIGSTAGLFGEADHADYAAAKAALAHGLTSTLKNEIVRLCDHGRVNCVCPGWVRTEMAEPALADPRVVANVTSTMAMRKIAEPEDVARIAVFLSSHVLAGHVTGTIVPVDGGMEGRLLHPID